MPAKATSRIVDDSCVDVERPIVAGCRPMQIAYRVIRAYTAVVGSDPERSVELLASGGHSPLARPYRITPTALQALPF